MIELVQIPWSPYCLVQRRILEFAGAKFKIINVDNADRSLIWKWSKERYYQVPIIRDGKTVVFEIDEDSQVIAKYLNEKFQLGLFPQELRGVQTILWRNIEDELEGICFRLNEVYWKEFVPKPQQLSYLRHKERKFGRGCFEKWTAEQASRLEELSLRLAPFEQMLVTRPFLLDSVPRFVDFDLFGILSNFLYSGHYKIPAPHTGLEHWYERMSKIKFKT